MEKKKINWKKVNKIIFFLLLFILIVDVILLINLKMKEKENQTYSKVINHIDYSNETSFIEECANLSLRESAYCVRNGILPFFKYHITMDKNNLTFDDLKTIGGDCRDWSAFYVRIGNKLGFYANRTVMMTDKSNAHVIAIWSNEHGYCVLDQTWVTCTNLG